jgi:glycolate oxidase FAD binding subunit
MALDLSALRGIEEYDPRELTITAQAATPVEEVRDALAEHGQQLPFDPPLGRAGATLGGVVAAGTSGAGAFRHGGVRDFVIGVRFVDGTGRLVGGGGRIVKNAAGFDLPKLMVGSCGGLGVLVELTFKVFPAPRETTTAVLELDDLAAALSAMVRLARGPLSIEALDLEPPGRVLVRLDGPPATRLHRVAEVVGAAPELVVGDADERRLWDEAGELGWIPADARAVRVATTPRRIPALNAALAEAGASARYSRGGQLAWVAWPISAELADLDACLRACECTGLALTGPPARRPLGATDGGAFAQRIRAALDPDRRFA